jgi:predicted O-linked N-acetylglucosamine transferase (SPINDLY family)
MGELIVADAPAYVDLVVRLAGDAVWRSEIREKIARHRTSQPLFDTARFTRHLERAFEMMAARARSGLEPEHFDVPAL